MELAARIERHRRSRRPCIGAISPASRWIRPSTVQEPVRVKVGRPTNQENQGKKVSEKSYCKSGSVGAEQIGVLIEKREHRAAADRSDHGGDIADRDVSFSVPVDEIKVPADYGT